MGMYTELHFNSGLMKDTPKRVINALRFMLGETEAEPKIVHPLFVHPLFDTNRWAFMLRSDSYRFDADTKSALKLDDIDNKYYLCIRCNVKNYYSEIEQFLSWIKPYLDKNPGDFLGFKIYEENQTPTLIYFGETPKERIPCTAL
jgi:hypothetical protein